LEAAAHGRELVELGHALPSGLRLGTSSWSFPGWTGLVWGRDQSPADLSKRGLAAYAAHPLFRTVGLDRTYYQPMSAGQLADLRAQVPPGFRFLVKAHQACMRPIVTEHATFSVGQAQIGDANPLFLDPVYATDHVVGPCVQGLGVGPDGALGPILFQFSPMSVKKLGGSHALLDKLAAFLERLPKSGTGTDGRPLYAVEVRNDELLTLHYAEVLRAHGVAHGFAVHPALPPPDQQVIRLAGSTEREKLIAFIQSQPALVARWLLIEGQEYEAAKHRYEPFDRVVDADDRSRDVLAALVKRALGLGPDHGAAASGREAYIIVNNKAEGSAPRSIERLAARLIVDKREG
jgi:uncharacterized protein YecE (DUF72 family)